MAGLLSFYKMRSSRSTILLLLVHITSSSAKNPVSPVYEVNEQARMDDKRPATQTFVPYSNPLAGNSAQNAKIHAQHQQAMFNAERVRQHRAQLQRWTKIPPHSPQTDSYMKAYHESQENHQLAIEQQQNKGETPAPRQRQRQTTTPPSRLAAVRQRQVKRKPIEIPETLHTLEQTIEKTTHSPRQRTRNLIKTKGPDPLKITLEDAVSTQKNRNHRSYGSLQNRQQLIPTYKTLYSSELYDQGVTIKPNGNVGLASMLEPTKLHTKAIPSKTVYPKQFHQMQNYESAEDISALNALLNKEPQDQVEELNALIQGSEELKRPIDLYFYLKDPKQAKEYSQALYAQSPTQSYASTYASNIKDHIPITEPIDDIEDPNKILKKPYTESFTKDSNIFNTNLFHLNPTVASKPTLSSEQLKYTAEDLKFNKPLKFYSEDSDETKIFHTTGVQHLNSDGTGVSAYGDDDIHYAANYEFGYRVRDHQTGSDFGHQETRHHENTNGEYHVLLPDGRMQSVKYHAGPEGYHADVSYETQ